ncbi:unnamed protein product [Brassica oleracea var. botrytis]
MDPIESVRYNDFEISTNGTSSHVGHGWKKVVYQNKTVNRNPLRIKRRETEKTLPTETQLTAITRGSEETDPRREMTPFTDDSKDESRSKRRSNSYDEGYDFDGSEDGIAAKKMDETKKKTKYSQ